MRNRSTALWMAGTFCAAMTLAAAVPAVFGAGERGTHVALQATARLSFVLFWPAYCAAALAALFGRSFQPLQRRMREFGLAFAAAHLVHPGLVAWLSYIGDAPPRGSFIFFGIAALCIVFAGALLGSSPAAGARGQRLVAPADRRPKLHCLCLCGGFLEVSCFCQRPVPGGVFAVCASCGGRTPVAAGGIRPARPHIRRQAATLRPLKSRPLKSRPLKSLTPLSS